MPDFFGLPLGVGTSRWWPRWWLPLAAPVGGPVGGSRGVADRGLGQIQGPAGGFGRGARCCFTPFRITSGNSGGAHDISSPISNFGGVFQNNPMCTIAYGCGENPEEIKTEIKKQSSNIFRARLFLFVLKNRLRKVRGNGRKARAAARGGVPLAGFPLL